MEVPRIIEVKPIDDMQLIVCFDGDIKKIYDVKKLFHIFPIFKELEDSNLFNSVKVEIGGIAIIWNENIDLSRYEIWNNGEDYIE